MSPLTNDNYTSPPRPTLSLVGKVALVTGSGSSLGGIGNGRASAILLAEVGAHVVCLDIQPQLARETVEMIHSEFGSHRDGLPTAISVSVEGAGMDVTKEEDCKRAVEECLNVFGRLDVLVNNVGVSGPIGTAIDVDPKAWARGLEVNVTGMMLMAKYAIPAMLRNDVHRGEEGFGGTSLRGSIVNIASVAGLQGGTPNRLLYPTSKGAVVNMTRAMANQHAAQGIRVNCVCPGMVFTPMMYARGMSQEERENRRKRSLLQTEGNGWDTGCSVRFLASDQARWITGAILPVDAGATAAIIYPKNERVPTRVSESESASNKPEAKL